ncbi:MAG: PAS domain-containing protein [Desulforhopalus sp.]
MTMLAEQNRSLTLEKNKYENILQSTSDIVLVINDDGEILEMKAVTGNYFGDDALGESVFEHISHPDSIDNLRQAVSITEGDHEHHPIIAETCS